MTADLQPLPMPLPGVPEPGKPVVVDAELHRQLAILAAAQGRSLLDVADGKLSELRDPSALAAFLGALPPKSKRAAVAATAQVYLPASLHAWLKVIAASHRHPLYQLVEEKLRELFPADSQSAA